MSRFVSIDLYSEVLAYVPDYFVKKWGYDKPPTYEGERIQWCKTHNAKCYGLPEDGECHFAAIERLVLGSTLGGDPCEFVPALIVEVDE